jgi:hypothetical protein
MAVEINSQPRSLSEYVKRSRDNLYRTNNTFLIRKKKMLRAIGRATLAVEWSYGEAGSVASDGRHAGVKSTR